MGKRGFLSDAFITMLCYSVNSQIAKEPKSHFRKKQEYSVENNFQTGFNGSNQSKNTSSKVTQFIMGLSPSAESRVPKVYFTRGPIRHHPKFGPLVNYNQAHWSGLSDPAQCY